MRTCNICNIEKADELFVRCAGIKSGYRAYCKKCHTQKQLARYRKDPELHKARVAEYQRKNPEKVRDWYKSYIQKNPDRVKELHRLRSSKPAAKERVKRWKEQNRERYNAMMRAYYHANKELRHAHLKNSKHKRRSSIKGHRGISLEEWRAMKKAASQRCHYCGSKARPLAMDHVIPLSKGGMHEPSNIVPACKSCNSRKHDKAPEVFAKSIGRLLV